MGDWTKADPTDYGGISWKIDQTDGDQVRVEVDGQSQVIMIQDLKHDRMAIKQTP